MTAPDVIGIDIGGTFTDVARLNGDSGELTVDKVPTTPERLLDGISAALGSLGKVNDRRFGEVGAVVHGTTVATNAMIEGALPRTALIVSAGFGDVLEIGTMLRPHVYDLTRPKMPPLVPRSMVVEVAERIDADGAVREPLDEKEIARVVSSVAELSPQAVAICLLFSYLNPDHEERLGRALSEAMPGVSLALSSEVDPEIREYPRANTTALNASLRPVVERYVEDFDGLLDSYEGEQDLFVMQSNGGLIPPAAVTRNAHRLLLSGPAGGVVAARRTVGVRYPDLITFDMGGTSSDLSLIAGGESSVQQAPSAHDRRPVRASALDIHAVGAGGGSIAEVVEGVLKVGPRSAGASPGPVAYGKGGQQPTVTDAQIVLGRIDPGGLLGGDMSLDVEAAAESIRALIAEPLGVSVEEAAAAMVEVAVAAMARGLRTISVNAGYDPADFTLVAFGGGGPLHACDLAGAVGIDRVLVPPACSVFSALGLICADLQQEWSEVIQQLADAVDPFSLGDRLGNLESRAAEGLKTASGGRREVGYHWILELCYFGQREGLRVEVPRRPGEPVDLPRLLERFRSLHEREFGHASENDPIEVTTARVVAFSDREAEIEALRSFVGPAAPTAPAGRRSVFFPGSGYLTSPVVARDSFGRGEAIEGPALVQERESTTVVPPGWRAVLDGDAAIRIEAVG